MSNWEEEEEEASAPSLDDDPAKITYHSKPSYFDEVLPEPRPFSRAELLREVGEPLPIHAC